MSYQTLATMTIVLDYYLHILYYINEDEHNTIFILIHINHRFKTRITNTYRIFYSSIHC